MHVSALFHDFARMGGSTVEVNFLGHICSVCVYVLSLMVCGCVWDAPREVVEKGKVSYSVSKIKWKPL
jgi:hypothetical protein